MLFVTPRLSQRAKLIPQSNFFLVLVIIVRKNLTLCFITWFVQVTLTQGMWQKYFSQCKKKPKNNSVCKYAWLIHSWLKVMVWWGQTGLDFFWRHRSFSLQQKNLVINSHISQGYYWWSEMLLFLFKAYQIYGLLLLEVCLKHNLHLKTPTFCEIPKVFAGPRQWHFSECLVPDPKSQNVKDCEHTFQTERESYINLI